MKTTIRSLLVLSLLVFTGGCDSGAEASADAKVESPAEGSPEASPEASKGRALIKGEIQVDMLDLDTTVELIKSGKVKDAGSLEKRLNDPKKKLAQIDLDGDGTIDFVQVVEVRKGDDITFELRVIPSTKKDPEYAVTVAAIVLTSDRSGGKIRVRATYTDVVEHHDVYVYEYTIKATWEGDVIIVDNAPFFGWVYGSHEVYVGVYVHEKWIAVPGVVIVDIGHHDRGKHHKFKHHKVKHHKSKGHKHGGHGHKGKIEFHF